MKKILLGLIASVPPLPLSWTLEAGPHFGNELMTLIADGRNATVLLEKTRSRDEARRLHEVNRLPLS